MAQLTVQQVFDLGLQHQQGGRLQEAENLYRQILIQQPAHFDATHLSGVIALQTGRLDLAVELIGRAIALRPGDADAHSNLGVALKDKGRLDEAIAAWRRAIALNPDLPEAHTNLGNALREIEKLDEAVAAFRRAISLRPEYAEAHNNLANAKDQGQLDDAISAWRQSIVLNPNLPKTHSNLILALHYHPAYDAQAIAEEHRRWSRRHAEPLRPFIRPHHNDRQPDRRLRIAYISADFREHSVGRFLLPLLCHHDHEAYQIICYSDVQIGDAMTDTLRACVDEWNEIAKYTDERVAEKIREDKIDILVDLAAHTAANRLRVFARKPAPVQVTYLAYCSSTGLEAMDYRLSDPYLDPNGEESFYSEQTVRLPDTYWCYQSIAASPEVGPVPALAQGFITFGSLNNFCKVSSQALNLWMELLGAIPKSQLILSSPEGSHRQKILDLFKQAGIDPQRLRFVGKVPFSDYLKLYGQIDIALDPFPFNGGTTTCDALWMGVPVVTLRGRTAVGRAGSSILCNIGLPELIAQTPRQYVQIATALAGDLPRLAELRRTRSVRMGTSPLMDARKFARNTEAAYRRMWRTWCQT